MEGGPGFDLQPLEAGTNPQAASARFLLRMIAPPSFSVGGRSDGWPRLLPTRSSLRLGRRARPLVRHVVERERPCRHALLSWHDAVEVDNLAHGGAGDGGRHKYGHDVSRARLGDRVSQPLRPELPLGPRYARLRSEEHTSELQS